MDRRVRLPQIMGHEMSGVIVELGPEVDGWSSGDRVVVRPLDPCGNCPACRRGHSHICQNLKFLGMLAVACHDVRLAEVKPGEKAVVIGGGPIGTLVALVARRDGADLVFEVSGSQAGASVMTQLPRTRVRIVVVAIFAEPPQVDLFRFFWREVEPKGARVYEPEDFERAIALAADGSLPLEPLITARRPIGELPQVCR